MYEVKISPGQGTHRYKAIIYNKPLAGFVSERKKIKTINFGARGYSNYTIHKDPERKKKYIDRHKTNENWNNILTAGFWSRWLLWEKDTIEGAKKYITRRFNVKFI